jgi:hypothetical protein
MTRAGGFSAGQPSVGALGAGVVSGAVCGATIDGALAAAGAWGSPSLKLPRMSGAVWTRSGLGGE